MGPDGTALPVPEGLPNAHMRLYGGAQYHRAMAEFRHAVGAIACPDITCAFVDWHLLQAGWIMTPKQHLHACSPRIRQHTDSLVHSRMRATTTPRLDALAQTPAMMERS